MGLNKNIIYSLVFIIITITAGYFIYVNFISPKDSRLLVKIIQGVNHQDIYDEEFTASYNYTYLLDKEKQVWFNYSPTEDGYSKNGTSTETRLYTFQNVSEINAWLDSIVMPKVVKGVAKTMMNMSIAEIFRVIEKQPQPTYGQIIEVDLGNRESYHYSVDKGRSMESRDSFIYFFIMENH